MNLFKENDWYFKLTSADVALHISFYIAAELFLIRQICYGKVFRGNSQEKYFECSWKS